MNPQQIDGDAAFAPKEQGTEPVDVDALRADLRPKWGDADPEEPPTREEYEWGRALDEVERLRRERTELDITLRHIRERLSAIDATTKLLGTQLGRVEKERDGVQDMVRELLAHERYFGRFTGWCGKCGRHCKLAPIAAAVEKWGEES